jgi:branched-chain amino acid transport system substrate-binding protein
MNRIQAASLILIAVASFGLAGCKKGGRFRKGTPAAVLDSGPSALGPIQIGEVGSMTGSDATFGSSTHNGILLAFTDINAAGGIKGRKLELITQDDQGKPSEAVLAITKLISQQRVHAVLGEVASTLSIAMAPIAQKSQIPMISPSSINSKLTQQGNYIFRVCFVDHFQSKVMADFAWKNLHAKRVAILKDMKSDYSRDSANIFSDFFLRAGGKIVSDQSYSGGDIDFKSQLTSIRAAHPDLILVPGYYTEIGLIARQKKELGIAAPMLGGDGWDSPKLKEIGGSALEGSYFVSHFHQEDPAPLIQKLSVKVRTV